jgi:hypothetical protein
MEKVSEIIRLGRLPTPTPLPILSSMYWIKDFRKLVSFEKP